MTDFEKIFPDNRADGDTVLRQAQLVMLRILKIVDYICRKHDIKYWLCSGTLLGAVRHKGFIPWDDDLDIAMMREDYEKFLVIVKEELPSDLFLQTRETEPEYDSLAIPCKIRDTKSLTISPFLDTKNYHKGLFIDIFPFDRYHSSGSQLFFERFIKRYTNIVIRLHETEIEKHNSIFKRIVNFFHPCFRWLILRHQSNIRPLIEKNKGLDEQFIVGHGFEMQWLRFFKPEDIFPLKEIEFEDGSFFAPFNANKYLKVIYGKSYMSPPPIEKRNLIHSTIIKPII